MTPHRWVVAGLLFWVVAAAAYGTLRLTFGPRPVFIHVRWTPAVDGQARQWLERRYNLSQGELLEGQTWGYTLMDPSPSNVARLVRDAFVEDTQNIDRAEFRVSASAPRLPYATSRAWIPVHLGGLGILGFVIGVVFMGLALIERLAAGTTSAWFSAAARWDVLFLLILVGALLLRLDLAATSEYIHDEENTSIPTSQGISFTPGNLQLPIRGRNHPALPAYFVKISSTLFGTTRLGYRLFHVIAAIVLIVMVFFLTRHWYGTVAARWAAALLAFNEYYLGVSGRATAHVPYLLFAGAAVYAFSRFLATERAGYLYAAGAALGVAFYSKEHAALLAPVFFVMLLHARYRHWFRSPHIYLAAALFALVIGPDLLWNLRAREGLQQATYGDHLQRIGGLGVSPYPFMFYGRDVVQWLHTLVTGEAVVDPTPEYRSMNLGIGALLLGAVVMATGRSTAPVSRRFLVLLFWGVFGFFASIRPGGSPKDLDPASWIWVDVTLLPTVMLAGAMLAGAEGRVRVATWALAGAAMIYAAAGIVG